MSPTRPESRLRRAASTALRSRLVVFILWISAVVVIAFIACRRSPDSHTPISGRVISLVVAGNANSGPAIRADARMLLIGRCMRGHGFLFPEAPPITAVPRVAPLLLNGEVASVPPESAAIGAAERFGFGLRANSQQPAGGSRLSQSASAQQSHGNSFLDALLGRNRNDGTFKVAGVAEHTYPTEGCVAAADRALYGSPTMAIEAVYLPEDLDLEVTRDVYRNPAYVYAIQRWSSCFKTRTGRMIKEPYVVAARLASYERTVTTSSHAMRAYERSVAVADVECQYSTRFISTAVRLRHRYTSIAGRRYASLLTTIVGVRETATRTANVLLEERRR